MRGARRTSILLAVSLLPVLGCMTLLHAPRGSVRSTDPIPLDTVVVLDKRLEAWVIYPIWWKGKLSVDQTWAERTEAGGLMVAAIVRNLTEKDQTLRVRTRFLDDQRREVEPATAWKTVFLAPRTFETYRAFSVGYDEIQHYYIEVRQAGSE